MDDHGGNLQQIQDQFARILTALGTSVAEGLTRGLEESKLLHQLVGMVQKLTERVEDMERVIQSLQDERKQAAKQAAKPVPAAAPVKAFPPKVMPAMSKPTVINRSRNR
jgi:hypothetical protein